MLNVKVTLTGTEVEPACANALQETCTIDADCVQFGGNENLRFCITGAAAVGTSSWANPPDAKCISIVGPDQPATPPNWAGCPVVHLTGCAIIPTSTYDITVLDDQETESAPLAAATQLRPLANKWWGDAVHDFNGVVPGEWGPPQGVCNFDDVTAALRTFQGPDNLPGCGAPPCNATHVSITDIHPARPDIGGNSVHPNKLLNIDDVFLFIGAFQGNRYPGVTTTDCTNPI